jgi:hypothetical protein
MSLNAAKTTPPALTPLLASQGYGRLSVSHGYMHLQTVGLLTVRHVSESHRSLIYFGEYLRRLPSEQSNLYWERQLLLVNGVSF